MVTRPITYALDKRQLRRVLRRRGRARAYAATGDMAAAAREAAAAISKVSGATRRLTTATSALRGAR